MTHTLRKALSHCSRPSFPLALYSNSSPRPCVRMYKIPVTTTTFFQFRYPTLVGTIECMAPTEREQLSEMRKGVLGYCVLARLNRGEAYGAELAKDLAQHTSLFASEGAIYPLLARLRKRGWVETRWEESLFGPPRRYYNLSPEGKDATERFSATWETFTSDVNACLTGSDVT